MAKRCWKRALKVFLVYYILLFVGAVIIMFIEATGVEDENIETTNITEPLERLLKSGFNWRVNVSSVEKVIELSNDIRKRRERIQEVKWRKKISWKTMYKWRYFTHITLTTVGYGNIVPITEGGRFFVVIYGMIGIPVNILVTTAIGFLLSERLNKLIRFVERHLFGIRTSKYADLKTCIILIIIAIFFLSAGAAVTMSPMKWTWIEGLYTAFVKFSTIGYGDYTIKMDNINVALSEVMSWYTNMMLAIVAGIFDSFTSIVKGDEQRDNNNEKTTPTDSEDTEMNGKEV
eukprot:Seg2582.2 transcript_id=Seg2582.2/GoldUCD/mRNA.D3Y31 product="Potassium channel subfamily K member 3" protein_id=Seg2582.2/GoldUCD/D3Y31